MFLFPEELTNENDCTVFLTFITTKPNQPAGFFFFSLWNSTTQHLTPRWPTNGMSLTDLKLVRMEDIKANMASDEHQIIDKTLSKVKMKVWEKSGDSRDRENNVVSGFAAYKKCQICISF